MRRRVFGQKLQLFTKRFYPAGNYTWVVPPGCTSVDVFLVGGGGGAFDLSAGGGGYTKTFKKNTIGYKDGDAIHVTQGQSVSIIVGRGGESVMGSISNGFAGSSNPGVFSQFMNSTYRANGGLGGGVQADPRVFIGGDGGSRGGAYLNSPGQDGSPGQGHTTRDFGEHTGNRNAGGGGSPRVNKGLGGESDYTEGSGSDCRNYGNESNIGHGGGGYGGGAGAGVYSNQDGSGNITQGGDGTVLIRYWAYTE